MILIVGGLGAGKRDFARRELGVREEELSPVLGPGTQVLYDLHALDPLPDLEELMGLRAVICNEVGCAAVAAAILVYLWYIQMARREFGGLTGDLAGWFLQVCELGCLAAMVLAREIAEVLI